MRSIALVGPTPLAGIGSFSDEAGKRRRFPQGIVGVTASTLSSGHT